MKNKMTNSLSRYIRKEKARIRRGVLNIKDQREAINELYKKYPQLKVNDNSGDIQPGCK